VLDELCSELSILRQPSRRMRLCHRHHRPPHGRSVAPYATQTFITPMARWRRVAEEILGAMTAAATLDRAYVNDGRHRHPFGARPAFIVGMVERPDRPSLFGQAILDAGQPCGYRDQRMRGRSFSLGIADAVTVLRTGCHGGRSRNHHRQRR